MMRALLIVEACVSAMAVRLSLRLGSVRLAAVNARRIRVVPAVEASGAECRDAADMAARWFAHPTCLYRALIAYGLLVRRHRATEFHLGASRREGLAAHAWVSIDGHSADPDASEYRALWTTSSSRAGS